MVIRIQRHRLSEMLQVVREKERQGFECVAPIRKIRNMKKIWQYRYGDEDFKQFGGVDEHTFYFVKMRKVETNERVESRFHPRTNCPSEA